MKPGDVVFLKSGSPAMTLVEDSGNGTFVGKWFDGSANRQDSFPGVALTADDPTQALEQARLDRAAAVATPATAAKV